jgi:multidrug resistance protein, MATE family
VAESITYRTILRQAWPIMVASASTPLLGLVDTAVIGHTGTSADLGAIAIGSLVLNFAYWAFGFLRMATTGFVAQAAGAGDDHRGLLAIGRATLIAAIAGVSLIALQTPLTALALRLMTSSPEVSTLAHDYVTTRIWSAPAALVAYVIMGTLIGLGKSHTLLRLQLLLNGTNAVLDIIFAGILHWGVRGIAMGTLIADWIAALVGAYLVIRHLWPESPSGILIRIPWRQLLDTSSLRHTLKTHRDIMVRTVALLAGFAWFNAASARLGDTTLAANHVLLGFISFSAFFLDGFANVTETLVGRAIGRDDRPAFDRAIRLSTQLAAAASLTLALGFWLFGSTAISLLTDLPAVQTAATTSRGFAALYIALGFAAFQLDGVFIGATRTREMRNASLLTSTVFVATSLLLLPIGGNGGLWTAFIGYVVLRGLTLALLLPRLRRALVQ